MAATVTRILDRLLVEISPKSFLMRKREYSQGRSYLHYQMIGCLPLGRVRVDLTTVFNGVVSGLLPAIVPADDIQLMVTYQEGTITLPASCVQQFISVDIDLIRLEEPCLIYYLWAREQEMAQIFHERMAAEMEEGFVIYINGIRLNKLRAVPHWLVANWKVAKMFKALEADPDSGFLGYTPVFLGFRKGAAMQYWRSLEDLHRFATDPNGSHLPAWKWYNEKADPGGGLGFWAELYVIEGNSFETFFRNVPPIGIGKFAKMVPMRDHERQLGLSPDGRARQEPSPPESVESEV